MIAFDTARAARIDDRDYFEVVLATVEAARRRIWASLFLYDVRPGRDIAGQVLELTAALVERRRLGVDVRVLMTGDLETADIAVANLATGILLDSQMVPQRRLFDPGRGERRGTHAKFAVIDDLAVAGSNNWADDAFRLNTEDGVLLAGEPVEQLAGEFLRLWALGKGLPRRGAD